MEAVAAAVVALCWGELVISLMALSALRASITHLTSGLKQGVSTQRQTTRNRLSLEEVDEVKTVDEVF